MFEKIKEARKQVMEYTAEQLVFGTRAYADMLRCWNIGLGDDEAAEAARKYEETRRDWGEVGAEDGLFKNIEEFEKLIGLIDLLDGEAMAFC